MPVTRDTVTDWMRRFADEMEEHRQELVRLDTAIGDGDHGTNMDRGMRKALEKLDASEQADPGAVLKTVAMALVSSAAGPLYGTLFLQIGGGMAGQEEVDLAGYVAAWQKGLEGVKARGKAEPGDKTMVDVLTPAQAAMEEAEDLDGALRAAVEAAEAGVKDTIPLVARKGRASYLGERSKDHQDPGATSTYYLFRSAAEALGGAG
jgi:phosphoenolpyruvate---glycerone phosphotransferase subunit DhaL